MSKRLYISIFLWAATLLPLLIPSAHSQEAAPAVAATPEAPAGMVYIAAGPFQMGSNNDGGIISGVASPQREVSLPAFFIDRTEVTNAEYKKYCDATGYPPPPDWKDGKFAEGRANWPVLRVNWWEARAYAAWAGKRLPTEAEWEKAARGSDAREYPWGNGGWDGDKVAVGNPATVGSKPAGASPYGVLDMSANAFEWVDGWFDLYPNSSAKSPYFGRIFRIIRGGSYDGSPNLANTYNRCPMRPQARSVWVGFRCAKSLS